MISGSSGEPGESDTAQAVSAQPLSIVILPPPPPPGMNTVPYPGTAIAWPSGAATAVVVLHNGYAAGEYCTLAPPPCTSPAYGHGFVVGLDASGNAWVSQIFQFESGISDRFINSVNLTFANQTAPTGAFNWSIQGGLTGPPLPPHGPGGNQQYSADDLSFAASNVAQQFASGTAQAAHQY